MMDILRNISIIDILVKSENKERGVNVNGDEIKVYDTKVVEAKINDVNVSKPKSV
jgi:hypothetical protein